MEKVEAAATTRGTRAAELVVIAASAGGVEALKELVSFLPATLACPVVVVLHVSATGKSVLPRSSTGPGRSNPG